MSEIINAKRDTFIRIFILLTFIETLSRIIFCLTYENKIYLLALIGVLVIFITFYIFLYKDLIKRSYAVGAILLFFFITHFIYVLGTFSIKPIMLLWFLVVPIAARIYCSNRALIIICMGVALSVLLITQMADDFSLISNHFNDIVLNHYGTSSEQFITNYYLTIIFFYLIIATYFLIQVLIIQYPKLGQHLPSLSNKETLPNNVDTATDTAPPSPSPDHEEKPTDFHSIRDVRLQGVYQLILTHMETSESYQNPDFTLELLALEMKINKNTISSALNRIGKSSFNELVNQFRVDKAKTIFSEETFKAGYIKEVYMSVGFKYHTTFNRAFKKSEGITPSEYIVNMENQKNHDTRLKEITPE